MHYIHFDEYGVVIKSIKGNTPWAVSLSDSYKDMKNNFEGLNYGLNNPDKDCRVWLEDLDYENFLLNYQNIVKQQDRNNANYQYFGTGWDNRTDDYHISH